MKKYIVRLESEERSGLERIVRVGKGGALTIRHANILLAVLEPSYNRLKVFYAGG